MSAIMHILPWLPLPILVALALGALLRLVPFDLLSYGLWTGLLMTLLSLVGLARPNAWLWMPTQAWAFLALGSGIALTVAALAWPAPRLRSRSGQQMLDEFLPEYQAVEYHARRTGAARQRVSEAVRQTTLADMPAALWLMRIRALFGGGIALKLPTAQPLLEMMLQPGSAFRILDESQDHDRVYGMVGTPWKKAPLPEVRSAVEFKAFCQPGAVRVAFNFKVADAGGRVCLSTETRALGTDPAACRTFARYWRLIYPGSAIIRAVWLDAIIRRAERKDA